MKTNHQRHTDKYTQHVVNNYYQWQRARYNHFVIW